MMKPPDPRFRLSVVTDDLHDGIDGLLRRMQAAERGGATMVLMRLKHADARTLVEAGRALVTGLGIPVIVRDRLDVAMLCGAAGVHLTAESMPAQAIRTQAPPGLLVGGSISTPADRGAVQSVDFVTAGPVWPPTGMTDAVQQFVTLIDGLSAPVIAVGGLTRERVETVRQAGASGVMLVQLPRAADDITAYVGGFSELPALRVAST